MNNTVVQHNGISYINMGGWYIGIHYVSESELLIYADHLSGEVVGSDTPTEYDDQWGVRLSVTNNAPAVSVGTTMRRSIRVQVK